METVFVLVMFVVIVSVAFRKDAFESLLFAVALAVGLMPEFLPMITTVTLGEGALRMAKQKVIVEIPFDFERRRLSIVVGSDGKRLLITKGAPESVLPICSVYETGATPQPLDGAAKAKTEDNLPRLIATRFSGAGRGLS